DSQGIAISRILEIPVLGDSVGEKIEARSDYERIALDIAKFLGPSQFEGCGREICRLGNVFERIQVRDNPSFQAELEGALAEENLDLKWKKPITDYLRK